MRSVRLLLGHRVPPPVEAVAVGVARVPGTPWADLNRKPQVRPRRLTRVQRRTLARRAWAWRLLLGAWLALVVLAGWLGVRWLGLPGLACPVLMLSVLVALVWCALVDLTERERTMRAGN